MVTSLWALGRNGVKDYVLQRVSALILGVAFLVGLSYFLFHAPLSYDAWRAAVSSWPIRLSFLLVLIALIVHAWIGVWTILTDYIHCFVWRLVAQTLLALVSLVELLWGFWIVWS